MNARTRRWIFVIGAAAFLSLMLLFTTVAVAEQIVSSAGAIVGIDLSDSNTTGTKQTTNIPKGKATYVGVDDRDTDISRKVLAVTSRWSNDSPPYYNGYGGLCELWVYDVYTSAGLPCNGTCCAYHHSELSAHKEGKIPKGAIIFSGIIPSTGQLYENDHRESAYCHDCQHYAGHVAIYVGNGVVAGSQCPYLMDLDTWIDVFGYGGWGYQ